MLVANRGTGVLLLAFGIGACAKGDQVHSQPVAKTPAKVAEVKPPARYTLCSELAQGATKETCKEEMLGLSFIGLMLQPPTVEVIVGVIDRPAGIKGRFEANALTAADKKAIAGVQNGLSEQHRRYTKATASTAEYSGLPLGCALAADDWEVFQDDSMDSDSMAGRMIKQDARLAVSVKRDGMYALATLDVDYPSDFLKMIPIGLTALKTNLASCEKPARKIDLTKLGSKWNNRFAAVTADPTLCSKINQEELHRDAADLMDTEGATTVLQSIGAIRSICSKSNQAMMKDVQEMTHDLMDIHRKLKARNEEK